MTSTAFRVRAGRPWARAVAVALQILTALNLLDLAARAALDVIAPGDAERVPLPLLVQRLFFGSALPALLCRALWTRTSLQLAGDRALLGLGAEVPFASIAALRPWRVPLPWPGFQLQLRSGRNFAYGICAGDPAPVAGALCAAASLPAPDDPSFRDAAVRRRTGILHHPAIKYGLVPAVVTFILFRLHQRISYGGLFGEWQSYGLSRWLHTLTGVTFYVFGHFALLAAGLRAIAEIVAQPVIRFAPRWGAAARWAVEGAAALAWYGGTAAALWLRLG